MNVLILGYGVRGRTYAKYAVAHPEQFRVVAVADPVFASGAAPSLPSQPSQPSQSPQPSIFTDWRAALESVEADAAIIALPDRLHCEAAEAALGRGLHILLEKPLGCSWDECGRIRQAQRRARRLVLTGYVLRFAAYYRSLRQVLRSGVIGELVSISHLVEIGYGKAAHAFCRGNWGREADGTSTLVQKCIHDFDLIAWWTGGRRVKRVASFGSLAHWKPSAAPAGSAPRCVACQPAVRSACPYDAVRLYLGEQALRYHFADESDGAMRRVVEDSPYGRCVYACGNDAVNRQSVLVEYADGVLVTLEMQAFTAQRRRVSRFYGSLGEIVADGTTIEIRPFAGERRVIVPEQHGAHGGGDREIMAEFHRLVTTASPERFSAILDAALESHSLAFAAEADRLRAAKRR